MIQSISGDFWGVITIAGPVILAMAIIVAMMRNRRSTEEKTRSEQAVRDQHNAERRKEGLPAKTEPVRPE